jgi:hypothetical protein
MVFCMNPPAIIEEATLRVSDHVRSIQQKMERDRKTQKPFSPKVIAIRRTHRSLRAKAHDKVSDFEKNYPW